MNLTRYTAAVSVLLALSACGGGGGGSDTPSTASTSTSGSSAPAATTTTTTTTSSTATSSADTTATTAASTATAEAASNQVSGAAIVGRAELSSLSDYLLITANTVAIDKTGDFNVLEIDGKKITLLPEGIQTNGIYRASQGSDGSDTVVAGNLKNARYGWYSGYESDNAYAAYLFYQGYETPAANMPVSGTASYSGLAIVNGNDVSSGAATLELVGGQSAFAVDFGSKTVTGTITSADAQFAQINLSGTVSGNAFSGSEENKMALSGKFYGSNADEMAGMFYSRSDSAGQEYSGVFGAAKQ